MELEAIIYSLQVQQQDNKLVRHLRDVGMAEWRNGCYNLDWGGKRSRSLFSNCPSILFASGTIFSLANKIMSEPPLAMMYQLSLVLFMSNLRRFLYYAVFILATPYSALEQWYCLDHKRSTFLTTSWARDRYTDSQHNRKPRNFANEWLKEGKISNS
jgi:hypothetical protein